MKSRSAWVVLCAAASLFSGCGSDSAPAASGCVHNADCADGLVCLFAECTKICTEDRDCPDDERCLKTDNAVGCVANQAASCMTSCPAGTVCGPDHECRTSCEEMVVSCLVGQACVGSVCAGTDPDHDATGAMLSAAGASGSGGNAGASGGLGGANGGGAGHGGSSSGNGGAGGQSGGSGISGHGGSSSGNGGAGGQGGGSGNSGNGGASGVAGTGGASGTGGAAGASTCVAGSVVCAGNQLTICDDHGVVASSQTCSSGPCSEPARACLTAGHIVQVDVGYQTACAVDDTGHVFCWGRNYELLAAGTSKIPPIITSATQVTGINDASRVTTGTTFRCALRAGGVVSCWGDNGNYALGVDGADPILSTVSLTRPAIAIQAMSDTMCALLDDHTVWCWGSGDCLGDGTTSSRSTPGMATVGNDIVQIVGDNPACARHADGTVSCWGSDIPSPITLPDVSHVVDMAQGIGEAIYFLLDDGTIVAVVAEMNAFSAAKSVPYDIGQKIVRIDAGTQVCLLLEDQSVYCAAPNGAGIYPPFMQSLPAGSAVQISDGGTYWQDGLDLFCVLTVQGHVECSGSDPYGELGDGKPDSQFSPKPVGTITASHLIASQDATFALDGTKAWVWGNTAALGGLLMSPTPIDVASALPSLHDVYFGSAQTVAYVIGSGGLTRYYDSDDIVPNQGLVALSAGGYSKAFPGPGWDMGLSVNGQIEIVTTEDDGSGWGTLADGKTNEPSGTSNTLGTAGEYIGLAASPTVSLVDAHACAFAKDHIDCWGVDSSGEIGSGSVQSIVTTPVSVGFGEAVTVSDVCVGAAHTCAVITRASVGAAEVDCWGDNTFGQLGSAIPASPSPVSVPGLSAPTSVACYRNTTCVWSAANGSVACFGDNSEGELGNGDAKVLSSNAPLAPAGLGPIVELSMGQNQVCAILKSDSTVWCWGSNFVGQAGGMTMGISQPFGKVIGLP